MSEFRETVEPERYRFSQQAVLFLLLTVFRYQL